MTTENIRATLGGVNLEGFGPINWRLAAGVDPVQEVFELHEDTARQLLTGGVPEAKELVITYPGGKESRFSGLYVLARAPGSRPDTMGILVSDLRWKWSRKLIKRSFNIRKRSGARRRLGPGGTPIEIATVADDVAFQPWSLMTTEGDDAAGGGITGVEVVRWTPQKALRNVMIELTEGEGFDFEFEIPDAAVRQSQSFEMIELADPGPAALSRLLSFIPGTDLYVTREGKVKFFNRLSGEESAELAQAEPYFVSGAVPRLIDFSRVRPSRVDVYFTPEIEVRFDTGGTVTEEARWMKNVLPLPDPDTELGGQRLVQGTWVPFSQSLYNSWNTPTDGAPAPPAGIPPISDSTINQYWFMDRMHQMYDRLGDFNPYQLWAQRIEAVKHHYRQTYQINPRWMEKMHSIRAYRVGILDTENGTRAPSQVYTDYCIRPNMKTMLRSPVQSTLGVNVFGYNSRLADAKAAPAFVDLLDGDIGILHFDYQLNPFGLTAQLIPSAVDNLPSCDIANLNRPICWSGARVSGGFPAMPQLHSTHQAAVVITAAPAAPNDIRQAYKRTVTLSDVSQIPGVGPEVATNGPPWQVWVGPLITARFMWSDSQAAQIEAVFGLGLGFQQLESLLVNGDDLDAVAKAMAASIYAQFTNRYQGGLTTKINQDVEPRGNLMEVAHTVSADGFAATSLTLPAERAKLDPWASLPASTRRIIFREVQP